MIAAAFRHGAHILVGAAALQAVIAFLAQLVLMRQLTPSDFGDFAVTLAAVGLIQAVVSLRLMPVILRATEGELTPEAAGRYHSALCWEALATLVLGLVWLAGWGPTGLWPAALVVTLALGNWAGQVVVFHERTMAYRGLAALETGAQLGGHALSVAVVLAGGGAAALYLREMVMVGLKIAGFARRGVLPRLPWRWLTRDEWRGLIGEARGIYAEGLLEGLFNRLVILATHAVVGANGTGIFAQAQRLAQVPHQFLSPLSVRYGGNLFGRLEDPAARRRALMQMGGLVGAPLALAAVAAVLLADPVVPWLFGEHWRPAAPVLAAMAGYILFGSLFDTLRVYAFTIRSARAVVAARIAQMGVFAGFAAVAVTADEPLGVLALGLSAAVAAAFAVTLAGVLFVRRGG